MMTDAGAIRSNTQSADDLQAQLARTARNLTALNKMGQTVTASLDLTEVLQRVIDEVPSLVSAKGVAILLVEGDELFFAAVSGLGAQGLQGQRMPANAGIVGEVMQSGESVSVLDRNDQARIYRPVEEASGLHSRALLAVPLKHGSQIIGVMEAAHDEFGAFSHADIEVMEAAAAWASTAIVNARLFEQVRQGSEQLRRLTQRVVSAQEEERRRIARELHDEAGQDLTAIRIGLDLLIDDIPAENKKLHESVREVIELTTAATQQIRLLAHGLRPPALEAVGLDSTLESFCHSFAQRAKLSIEYHGTPLPELSDDVAISFYRTAQEALTNVVKHAEATHVTVTLRQNGQGISLSIEDNGKGFDQNAVMSATAIPTGLGIIGMQERLDLLDGKIEISSRRGAGTHLHASVPWGMETL